MTAPKLLADIGGTNARFALQVGERFEAIDVLACAGHATLADAIDAYLARAAAQGHAVGAIAHAAIAIANPVEDDLVRMTNHHWSFSIAHLRAERRLATLLVVNDFAALAMALPYLRDDQRARIGGSGAGVAGKPIGLIGPGTGLGVSGVVPCGAGWTALAGEGGHASFAPNNEDELRILQALWQDFGHVSAERLLSGMGLELMHRVLAGERLGAADITARAHSGASLACLRSVQCFCGVLGSVAGNVALTLGATGGMYIGGGIVPRLGELFARSTFRQRFEDKGRLSAYLARIPTYLITEQYPALVGVAAMLTASLAHDHTQESPCNPQ
ncbi:glucokinase [Massilia sp. DWR3-1-1]|uniref:glucokinase n=1 Tax=Massilia sp. DWR3-1-1 TaxID=2804559 RepID=UPI003CF7D496